MEEECSLCKRPAFYHVNTTSPHSKPVTFCEECLPGWAWKMYQTKAKADKRGLRELVTLVKKV